MEPVRAGKLDGALQAEEEVASAMTDATGEFIAEFERRSSGYSLQWTASARSVHHGGRIGPGRTVAQRAHRLPVPMNAVCTLHVNLASLPPEDSTDVILFNLGEAFPCPCCDTEQVLLEGVGADSAWTCLMHGDRWMTWGADLEVALIQAARGPLRRFGLLPGLRLGHPRP